jgi:hypothetical protein
MPITINGQEALHSEFVSEHMLYCTTTAQGLGDGSSWDSACTFRTAVSKLASGKQNTIFLGAGLHDTNNGADNTGTTISTNYVRLVGFEDCGEIGQASQMMNSKNGATNILIVTGSRFVCNAVVFDNAAQTTKALTGAHLTLSGSYSTVMNSLFRQNAADGANTGVLCNNSGVSFTIERCRFRWLEGNGVNLGAAQRFYLNNNVFWKCTKGLYASSADADGGIFRGNSYINCTTAWDLDTAVAKEWYSIDATFANNTTNCAALSAYGGTIIVTNARTANVPAQIFPTGVGITIAKTAAAWVQGAYVNFLTEDTITKPFIITAVNVQGNNAAQTYRLEIFYGAALASATTSLGNFEIQVTSAQLPSVRTNMYIPARAALRCKLASSTAATDDITISIQYQVL